MRRKLTAFRHETPLISAPLPGGKGTLQEEAQRYFKEPKTACSNTCWRGSVASIEASRGSFTIEPDNQKCLQQYLVARERRKEKLRSKFWLGKRLQLGLRSFQ
jgi:hypothetical protein